MLMRIGGKVGLLWRQERKMSPKEPTLCDPSLVSDGDTDVSPVLDILMGNSMNVRWVYGDQHLQSKPLTLFLPSQKKKKIKKV